jgi:hypothetical protein
MSQEFEVNSIPLNPVAYPGEIWLPSFDVSVGLNYSPVDHASECRLPPPLLPVAAPNTLLHHFLWNRNPVARSDSYRGGAFNVRDRGALGTNERLQR